MKTKRLWILGALIMVTIVSCATRSNTGEFEQSPQYMEGKFHNPKQFKMMDISTTFRTAKRYLFEKRQDVTPELEVPMISLDASTLQNQSSDELAIYRLGHSSILVDQGGKFWLIDPVFSERASPVSWAGPKRFHPTPISLERLPTIEGVIISHDHYDHLDHDSIQALKDKTSYFVTPLGVGERLKNWGVAASKIHQLDWWQSVRLNGVELTATPAQHFSGRSIGDSNRTLWASWVIKSPGGSIYFSGDSGYFDGFKEIGERLGPFDLTLIENGAYDQNWSNVHMQPEQSLQAHQDLKGRAMMPVHNGTFDLALHPWHEPFERIRKLAASADVNLLTPIIGERVRIKSPASHQAWWQGLNPSTDPSNSANIETQTDYSTQAQRPGNTVAEAKTVDI